MRLDEIKRLLKAEVCSRTYDPHLLVRGAAAADLMSDVLTFSRAGALLLTGLINPQVVRTAEVASIAAVVFVRGKCPPEETIRLAEENGLPLLITPFTLFTACGRLHAAGLRGCEDIPGEDRDAEPGEVPIGSAE